MLAALIKSLKDLDENTQDLEKDIAEFQARYDLIIEKYERMLGLSGQIEERQVQNAFMCQTSVSELQRALFDVNEKYNDAVRALDRPWYLRPMFSRVCSSNWRSASRFKGHDSYIALAAGFSLRSASAAMVF